MSEEIKNNKFKGKRKSIIRSLTQKEYVKSYIHVYYSTYLMIYTSTKPEHLCERL